MNLHSRIFLAQSLTGIAYDSKLSADQATRL